MTRGELFPSLSAFICEMDILEDDPGMFLRDPQKLGAGEDSWAAGRTKERVTGLFTLPARAEHLLSGCGAGSPSIRKGGHACPRVTHGLRRDEKVAGGSHTHSVKPRIQRTVQISSFTQCFW